MAIIDDLRSACEGHPHAKIAWPHRLLHEAIEALESAHAALDLVKAARPTNVMHAYTSWEIPHSTFIKCGEARQRIEASHD